MSLKRNFSVGFINSIWGALLSLAVVPFYLKYLGTEAYGLIGFYASIQALLQLLDLGLSPTINREIARCSASGNMSEGRNLLHTLSIVYWVMACVVALVIFSLSPLISKYWLNSSNFSEDTVKYSVMLMGLVVACRWPVGLYMGALMGLQKVALSSTVGALIGTLSSLGAIAVLAFVSPTIQAFFIWQAFVGLVYVIIMRWLMWKLIGEKNHISRFDFGDLKRIWKFSAGMSGITVTGVIMIQMNKVILSKMLSLGDFGRYVLAGVLANGLYILLTPLFNAIYPRMTALVASGETNKLIDLYKVGTRSFLAIFFPIAITCALFSKELLYLWTRNLQVASSSALIASLLILGTTLNGVMHFPFAIQLAYGSTRLPLKINMILLSIMVPMTIILTVNFGAVGGAGSWALLNVIYLFVGTWMTHCSLLKGIGIQWLFGDVMLPLAISIMTGGIGKWVFSCAFPLYTKLLVGIILIIITFVLIILVSHRLKEVLRILWSTRDFWIKAH
ncbi:MAG: polysaccharide biosynthesis protein [Pseudomonadota bacterium]|nr:polysaccharide biosynthesis protein [Pseudomonadota bacterium]